MALKDADLDEGPVGSQANMSGYLWEMEDTSNDPFFDSAAMFFFYVVRRNSFWAEGFASRFVNISQLDVEPLKMNSGAGISEVGRLLAVPLLVGLLF